MTDKLRGWPESNRTFLMCRKTYNFINNFNRCKIDERGFKRINKSVLIDGGAKSFSAVNLRIALYYLVKHEYLEIDENYEKGKYPMGYKILKKWDFKDPKARKKKRKK